MKRQAPFLMLIVLFLSLSGFAIHKFYVSIYQVNYNQKKQMLEITSRIFIDDLNDAMTLEFNKKTTISDNGLSNDDLELLKKYVAKNFVISINGLPKTINYISSETEPNVLICYFSIKNIPKIKKMTIENKLLLELNSEQQNIIQTTIYGKKKSLLLTNGNQKESIAVN